MEDVELTVLGLLFAVCALTFVARRLDIPYPIFLVLGGAALGFLPGVPEIELEPDLVLLIFLPPLLFNAAYFASVRDLRANLRPISLSAVGLVLLTMCTVAVVVHEAIGGVPWAAAFALGAVVAPTDPLAATAIARRLGVPRGLTNIIEGESLVNDGTALVAYRTAVAAAVGGSFDLFGAGLAFVVSAVGGALVGLVVAQMLSWVFRRTVDDPVLGIVISLGAGYVAYLPAEQLELSGVLAAVTTGLVVGHRSPALSSSQGRISGYAFWEVLVFMLNAVLFVLVGLQLPDILDDQQRSLLSLVALGAAVSAAVIGARLVWLNTVPYLIRAIDRRPAQRQRRVGWRPRLVVAWSGMRGSVSLAAALALPETVAGGAPFPERDLLIFLAFSVIFSTLVLQGLTLPALIRTLGVEDDGGADDEELQARRTAVEAALRRLSELGEEEWTRNDTVERMTGLYEFRARRFAQRAGGPSGDTAEEDLEARSVTYQRTLQEVLVAQRLAIVELRDAGEISDEVMHLLEREFDLEEERLEVEPSGAGPDRAFRLRVPRRRR